MLCSACRLCTGSAVGFSGTTDWRPRCFSPRSRPLACCGSSPTTFTCRPSGRSTQQMRRRSSVVTRPSSSCCLGLCSETASWGSGWVHLPACPCACVCVCVNQQTHTIWCFSGILSPVTTWRSEPPGCEPILSTHHPIYCAQYLPLCHVSSVCTSIQRSICVTRNQ